MSATSFEVALAHVLAHEGGYTNHPSDPGGPTNFGITIRDCRKYVKPNASASDVRAMSVGEAAAIYRSKYWDAQCCDALPVGVDYAIFDYGVNSGIGRSGKVLRRALKLADNTSVVTDVVIAAARNADASALVRAICDERLRFLQSLKTWAVFGKGWGRRVAEVKVTALAMADGAKLAPASRPSPGRGIVPAPKAVQQTSAGVIAAAGAATAQQAHQSGGSMTTLVLIVLTTAVLAAVAWRVWHWRQQRQQERSA